MELAMQEIQMEMEEPLHRTKMLKLHLDSWLDQLVQE